MERKRNNNSPIASSSSSKVSRATVVDNNSSTTKMTDLNHQCLREIFEYLDCSQLQIIGEMHSQFHLAVGIILYNRDVHLEIRRKWPSNQNGNRFQLFRIIYLRIKLKAINSLFIYIS